MEFRISNTFTDALTKLTNQEQKAVKTTVFDLQMDPSGNSLRFHKLDKARDKNFWSVSVNIDIRIIVHRSGSSLLLCYVDHHDPAYRWAASRKLEVHPKTGAAQLVEIEETVRKIEVPVYVQPEAAKIPTRPLKDYTDDFLLQYGIPEDWLDRLRQATEDELLELADRLPDEAAEAILDIAIGKIPSVPEPVAADTDPFEHPDALRRFRTIDNQEELRAALDYPWDKWTIFLHPAQRTLVEKDFSGPARVSGSAGTGKTVVALHRAVYLARKHPNSRILLTTFSDALANALTIKRNRLIAHEPQLGEQIEVRALNTIGQRLYRARGGKRQLVKPDRERAIILNEAKSIEQRFTDHFLVREWREVVDPWQLRSWETYRDVIRIGRKTRLPESQREQLWQIYRRVFDHLEQGNLITQAGIFQHLADLFSAPDQHSPFDFIVVDEAQDISVPQLRFLASLSKDRPNHLFFAVPAPSGSITEPATRSGVRQTGC